MQGMQGGNTREFWMLNDLMESCAPGKAWIAAFDSQNFRPSCEKGREMPRCLDFIFRWDRHVLGRGHKLN